MTEAEWMCCTDPQKMLEFLRDKASDRKLRLVACACCRSIWHLLKNERSRKAVEVAERFAEGTATEEELTQAEKNANNVWYELAYAEGDVTDGETDASDAACGAACYAEGAIGAARSASHSAAYALSYDEVHWSLEKAAQARLLRDIFGNPIRPVSSDPAWLTPTVLSLARAAYKERDLPAGTVDNARLAILADALEDAGCDDADILNHCHQSGEHYRGCWLVDLLLGKQ